MTNHLIIFHHPSCLQYAENQAKTPVLQEPGEDTPESLFAREAQGIKWVF